jgi:hypothetical protein
MKEEIKPSGAQMREMKEDQDSERRLEIERPETSRK